MEPFRKRQDEVIAGCNEKKWLTIDVSKVTKFLKKGMSIVVASLG